MESYHDLSALLLTPNANVSTILEALTNNLRNVKSQFLIIDYLQLLVMSDICTPLEVIDLIYEIAKLTGASHLYLMVNNDEQFIGSDEGNNTAEFLLELTHRCNVVSSMEPLSTGSASDVTGVFRIVAGPKVAGLSLEDRVNESEMLYFVNPVGNASVKFFHR